MILFENSSFFYLYSSPFSFIQKSRAFSLQSNPSNDLVLIIDFFNSSSVVTRPYLAAILDNKLNL